MRCRHCEYVLWNLAARNCPECGETWRPSEYEFVPNQVRFCCPHCDQAYYGTTPDGMLDPPAFTCVKCQQPVTIDEMVLRPAEGATASDISPRTMPWLEREPGHWVRPWFATLGQAMVRPHLLARALPTGASLAEAWRFQFVSNLIFGLFGQLLPGLLVGAGFAVLGRVLAGGNSPIAGLGLGRMVAWQIAGQFVFAVVAYAVIPFVWGAAAHGLLAMTGRPPLTMRHTIVVICYSSGARAIDAIPCVRGAGVIWWLVSAIIMLKERQGCGGGKATFAVLVGGIASTLLVVGGSLVVTFASMGIPFGQSGVTGRQETAVLVSRLLERVDDDGIGPASALRLLEGTVATGQFLTINGATDPTLIAVGDTTLADLVKLGPNRRKLLIDEITADQPPIVADRVGDFVFTYHGARLDGTDGELWIVVLATDPDQRTSVQQAFDVIPVGLGDGSVTQFVVIEFAEELAKQNAYRATLGLPPLPDPREVRHGKPALAPPEEMQEKRPDPSDEEPGMGSLDG